MPLWCIEMSKVYAKCGVLIFFFSKKFHHNKIEHNVQYYKRLLEMNVSRRCHPQPHTDGTLCYIRGFINKTDR